ncbi:hypothetical protein B7R25_14095 [Subtercola boreus]|uniref:Type IV secretion protein Rhs n=1 Tax=Subtercola boreus TaxID=120213 RepID=A0A3E0W8R3_9MICO|nr:hypothetical protein B7R24_13995 [Subtercola boreus]RFA18958.1 hypothetical protein B7R23_13985 [Subtercola boreus]RFA25496.1 hypothetical protein B7R25_14095 [Subtercola boreus]
MGTNNRRQRAHPRSNGFGGWLNDRLFPYLGPPPLGPFDTESAESKARRAQGSSCPLCGQLMAAHTIDRSGERTQLYCPTQGTKTS